jgi:hypothetical protein
MSKGNQLQSEPILQEEFDQEWVVLITEAMRMGLTKEEIREFLMSNGDSFTHDQLAQTV